MYNYPTAAPPVTNPVSALLAGGFVILIVYIALVILGICINYLFFKAIVRNGVIEAIKKTGLADSLSSARYVSGYPPEQSYGAPPAPTAEYRR